VQAILAARIDRLPAGQKDLLETVAVIGKDFRLGLVDKVVARPQEELEHTLGQLQLAEFIYEQPATGDIEYRFKHPLTHEAAYNSVLIERRKALHERVAQAVEELAGNSLDDYLADLAHHYGRSSNRGKAVDYLTRAGMQIARRSASPEAMQYFGKALDILKEMPSGQSRGLARTGTSDSNRNCRVHIPGRGLGGRAEGNSLAQLSWQLPLRTRRRELML
jgi:predicted ATPase